MQWEWEWEWTGPAVSAGQVTIFAGPERKERVTIVIQTNADGNGINLSVYAALLSASTNERRRRDEVEDSEDNRLSGCGRERDHATGLGDPG